MLLNDSGVDNSEEEIKHKSCHNQFCIILIHFFFRGCLLGV